MKTKFWFIILSKILILKKKFISQFLGLLKLLPGNLVLKLCFFACWEAIFCDILPLSMLLVRKHVGMRLRKKQLNFLTYMVRMIHRLNFDIFSLKFGKVERKKRIRILTEAISSWFLVCMIFKRHYTNK